MRRLLGAVPLAEYRMQETGVMAYSYPDNPNLTFFWNAFHCWTTAGRRLIVTTLQPQRFPLINDGTEDRVELLADPAPSLPFRCARIAGRARDVLLFPLRGGRSIEGHSELNVDVLDALQPQVRSYR